MQDIDTVLIFSYWSCTTVLITKGIHNSFVISHIKEPTAKQKLIDDGLPCTGPNKNIFQCNYVPIQDFAWYSFY